MLSGAFSANLQRFDSHQKTRSVCERLPELLYLDVSVYLLSGAVSFKALVGCTLCCVVSQHGCTERRAYHMLRWFPSRGYKCPDMSCELLRGESMENGHETTPDHTLHPSTISPALLYTHAHASEHSPLLMFLDCGRKSGYLEKTHTHTGRTCKVRNRTWMQTQHLLSWYYTTG